MFFLITIFLTALVSALFGLLPGKLQRRSVIKQDIVWAVGLWLATWLFAVFAYHRPGLTIGFNAFRLVAVTALNGWTGFVTAGLRSFGRKGLKAVVPLLLVTALGLEVFVGNVAYFNTHSYEPFQLVDYLDENINVGRGLGTISLDEGRTYLRFLNIDRPIYNLRFDGLVNDDTDLLHADSAVTFTIEGTDAANTQLTRFGSWQVGLQAPRTHTISLDLTGKRSGRGAYLCPSAACLAKARKAKRLEHAFGVPVPDEVFERLTEEMACAEQAVKEAMPRGE